MQSRSIAVGRQCVKAGLTHPETKGPRTFLWTTSKVSVPGRLRLLAIPATFQKASRRCRDLSSVHMIRCTQEQAQRVDPRYTGRNVGTFYETRFTKLHFLWKRADSYESIQSLQLNRCCSPVPQPCSSRSTREPPRMKCSVGYPISFRQCEGGKHS